MQQQRILVGRELRYRNGWLIRLRYLAVAGMVGGCAAGAAGGLVAPWAALAVVAAAVLAYNLVLHAVFARARIRDWFQSGYSLAVGQVVLDLVSLTALVHFAGGVLTPLVFFYVFHGIIAAILLSRRAAYGQATLAVTLLVVLAALESAGVLPPPRTFWTGVLSPDLRSTLLLLLAVAATLYLSVYMTFSLSRELRAREERAQAANERLLEQDRLRAEYVRLIAHDLKDPLAGIQSTLRVVLDGYVGPVDPRQRDFVARAEERAVQLMRLIREMLDLARIRRHEELERSRWSFVEMVRGVAESFRAVADERKLCLRLELPPVELAVHANRNVIEQVVQNLIGNAVKYTPDSGLVSVRLRDRGGFLQLTVADTGIGIPPEALPRVFDEFYRAPNAKLRTRDGTGLGLSLVREIVAAYGGTIRAESPWRPTADGAPGGSLFTVRIPWTELTRADGARPPDGPSP